MVAMNTAEKPCKVHVEENVDTKVLTDSHGISDDQKLRTDLCSYFEIATKELGRGSNAVVHRIFPKASVPAIGPKNRHGWVAKFFDPAEEGTDTKHLASLKREFSMLASVQPHPSVVGLHGLFHAGPESSPFPNRAVHALVMGYCPGGDLFGAIAHNRGPFPEAQAASILGGVLSALAHIHKRGIVHRDVKAENVLLSEGCPLLADFGLACHMSDVAEMSRRCGSPGYVAPELISHRPYCGKVDVFGAGVILYLLVQGKLPFFGPDVASILRKTSRCRVKFSDLEGCKPLAENCKRCLLALLSKEPSKRPDAAEALTSIWLQSSDLVAESDDNQPMLESSPVKHSSEISSTTATTCYDSNGRLSSEGSSCHAISRDLSRRPTCETEAPRESSLCCTSNSKDSSCRDFSRRSMSEAGSELGSSNAIINGSSSATSEGIYTDLQVRKPPTSPQTPPMARPDKMYKRAPRYQLPHKCRGQVDSAASKLEVVMTSLDSVLAETTSSRCVTTSTCDDDANMQTELCPSRSQPINGPRSGKTIYLHPNRFAMHVSNTVESDAAIRDFPEDDYNRGSQEDPQILIPRGQSKQSAFRLLFSRAQRWSRPGAHSPAALTCSI